MPTDPFAPIDGAADKPATKAPAWIPVMPVPAHAPPPPAGHPKLGKHSSEWIYFDASGGVLGYVRRFDESDGKVFRPLIFARCAASDKSEWRWESWPPKRPLYGLLGLARRPSAPVVVTEGEKACDAACGLLPDFVVVTSPNGSKSAGKADWSPLKGRRVIVWPDADSAGLEYALTVAKHAGAASVAIISPPGGVKVGWDAADAVAEGWTERQAAELVEHAKLNEKPSGHDSGKSDGRRRPPQRNALLELGDGCEFWHDARRMAFGSYAVNDHREHWPIRSREFKMWLAGRFYQATGGAIGGQAIEDALRIFEARAVNDGPQYETFLRVGREADTLYLDLCDRQWRAVQIDRNGWRIIEGAGPKLLRSPSMHALPEPEAGESIEELRRFVNVRRDDDFVMTVAWAVAALRDRGPFPILVVNGEQGAGKSNFCRMIRSLVDPSAAPIRAIPKDDRDLVVSAGNSWVMAFDNLSSVPSWLSDALCRLATGGGFATRTLHSDREETIFEAQRPNMLNGIPLLTDRPDLADRAVTIYLRAITDEERQPEDELWLEFERVRPRILGALLTAASAALRRMPTIHVERLPRMADFVKWVTAAEPGLGWDEGRFLSIYRENRRDVTESSFEADPVAVVVRDFINGAHPEGWTGTATELLAGINGLVSEGVRKSRIWPSTAQGLGNRIDRIAPLLRGKGFAVEKRHSGVRTITITPIEGASLDKMIS